MIDIKALERLVVAPAYSPYSMKALVKEATGKVVPPQMFYNYIKNGLLAVTTNELGKKQVSQAEALRWLTAYCERINKQAEKVEAELTAE